MIGHVFASSGAITLAVAPSTRVGDYVVLARTENGYAVADVPVRSLPAPRHWAHGSYFDDRGDQEHLVEAVEAFCESTGVPMGQVVAHVRYALGHLESGVPEHPATATDPVSA